jgi:hypothetical protein
VRFVFASALALAGCTATDPPAFAPRSPAPAAEAPPRPPDLAAPAAPPTVDDRYFLSMFATDLVALVPVTYWMSHPDASWAALPSLVLPPLVHVAHGEPRTAGISFAMRAAMVGVVYIAGQDAKSECASSDQLFCVPLGPLLIANTAIVLTVVTDAILLARTSRPDSRWHDLRVLPTVGPGGVGVIGRF